MTPVIVQHYNGLDFFVTIEVVDGAVKIYRAGVAKMGEDPVAMVVVAAQDHDNLEIEEKLDEATIMYLYQTFIDDTMNAIKRARELGLLDTLYYR